MRNLEPELQKLFKEKNSKIILGVLYVTLFSFLSLPLIGLKEIFF